MINKIKEQFRIAKQAFLAGVEESRLNHSQVPKTKYVIILRSEFEELHINQDAYYRLLELDSSDMHVDMLNENDRLREKLKDTEKALQWWINGATNYNDLNLGNQLLTSALKEANNKIDRLEKSLNENVYDAIRFQHIAEYERVTATNKWLIQVIDGKGYFHSAYFKVPPQGGTPKVLHASKLEALRAAVDEAMQYEMDESKE